MRRCCLSSNTHSLTTENHGSAMAAATKDPTSRRPRTNAGIAPRRRAVQGTLHPGGRLAQPWREDRSIWRAGGRHLKSVEKRTPPCGRLIRSFTRREVWQRGAVGVRQPRWQSDPQPLLRLTLGSQIRQETRPPATPKQHFNAACVYFYLFA